MSQFDCGGIMSDIFISYARNDWATARSFAHRLTESGYDVWWDHELHAGDEFRRVIQHNLEKTKAVIVIWSESSAVSRFVCDEVDEAVHRDKLIATHVAGFDPRQIPIGFRSHHAEHIGDFAQIVERISELGIRPSQEGFDPEYDSLSLPDKLLVRAGVYFNNLRHNSRVLSTLSEIDRWLKILIEFMILFVAAVAAYLCFEQLYIAVTEWAKFDVFTLLFSFLIAYGMLALRRYARTISVRSRVITAFVIVITMAIGLQ